MAVDIAAGQQGVAIRVTGLRQLQKALKETGDATPKAIQQAHKEVAEHVLLVAQASAAGTTLASRMRPVGTTRTAGIRFLGHQPKGTVRTTDAALQEWGGRAPLFGNRHRWFEVKPVNKQGYFINPAIRATRGHVMSVYELALDNAIRDHYSATAE